MSDFEFDLLGDPIPEGFKGRGRPPHEATEEKRRIVMELLAFDWSLEKIAAALSVTPPTLRKHYFRELKARDEARARLDAEAIHSLAKEARGGNVSAISKMMDRLDRLDSRKLADKVASRGQAAKPMGKKEAALNAANEVRGKFAPRPAPLLHS